MSAYTKSVKVMGPRLDITDLLTCLPLTLKRSSSRLIFNKFHEFHYSYARSAVIEHPISFASRLRCSSSGDTSSGTGESESTKLNSKVMRFGQDEGGYEAD